MCGADVLDLGMEDFENISVMDSLWAAGEMNLRNMNFQRPTCHPVPLTPIKECFAE